MTQQKSTQEIVKEHCERAKVNFEPVYIALHQQIKDGSVRVLRSGDTLLVYRLTEPHEAEAMLITSESPARVVSALRDFYKSMQIAGFVRVTANLKTKSIAPMMRRAGIPFTMGEGNRAVIGA